ncbi:hypothetical protein AB6867_26235 [Serratia proteamaculans]|uniref:hypothetical protein n=1 Tax=Serratia proteamaculans TaxID=28151 RepID=UPI0039BE81B0
MKNNELIAKSELSIEESKRIKKIYEKYFFIFLNIGTAIGIAGYAGWVLSHKIFEMAFYKGDVREGADLVKAMWNVMMYLVPGMFILLGAGFLAVAVINLGATYMEQFCIRHQKRKILHFSQLGESGEGEPAKRP